MLIFKIAVGNVGFIKENGIFPDFNGWQDGYAAFTYSIHEKDRLIEYIKNQEIHHEIKSFREELSDLLQEHGIAFDEKYLL